MQISTNYYLSNYKMNSNQSTITYNFRGSVDKNVATVINREMNDAIKTKTLPNILDKTAAENKINGIRCSANKMLLQLKELLGNCHPDTVLQITSGGKRINYNKLKFKRWLDDIIPGWYRSLNEIRDMFPEEELTLTNKKLGTSLRLKERRFLKFNDFDLDKDLTVNCTRTFDEQLLLKAIKEIKQRIENLNERLSCYSDKQAKKWEKSDYNNLIVRLEKIEQFAKAIGTDVKLDELRIKLDAIHRANLDATKKTTSLNNLRDS